MVRTFVSAVLCSAIITGIAQAAEPDGTWKWTSQMQGRTINSVLRLESDGNKLTGQYNNDNLTAQVADGKVTDGSVAFEVNIERPQRTIVVKFDGEVADDTIEGTVAFFADGQQMGQDFPWTANRHVGNEEVVGTWNFDYTSPDGNRHQPILTITEENGELSGIIGEDSTAPVESLKVADNEITFGLKITYQGAPMNLTYKLRPRGNKLAGMLGYDVGGNTGEFEISAVRKQLAQELKSLLGSWEFSVTGDDGVERHPVMKLTDNGGELAVSISDEDKEFELRDVRVEDGNIKLSFTNDHDGLAVNIDWTCHAVGDDKMEGTLAYDAQGNVGEIEISANRK